MDPPVFRIPKTLCDALAIRADTLPGLKLQISVRLILRYCEGDHSYQKLRDPKGLWLRMANDPALGLTGEQLSERSWNITPEEFQRQYAPEISFCKRTADLLLHSTQEEFDFGLEAIIEIYVHTPSPRSEMERLKCLIKSRMKGGPMELESFLWALWRGDRAHIFEKSRLSAQAIAFAAPAVKAILSEYYATECAMVQACLKAVISEAENWDKMETANLDPNQTFDQWRQYLLRTYVAARVPDGRCLPKLGP